MDRNPIDNSHDGESPAPSGWSAEERSLPTTAATDTPPAVASPVPPPVMGSDRPADPNPLRFEPEVIPSSAEPLASSSSPVEMPPPPLTPRAASSVPAPPPAPRPAQPVRSAPPTAGLTQPPTASNPPRPGEAPPLGPPDIGPLGPLGSPTPEGPKRSRWRAAAMAAGVTVVAASLVSGGIVIGDALADEQVVVAPSPVDTPISAADDDDDDGPATLELEPGPLAGEDSDEPVADVANAVSPSVVLIQTNIGQGSGIVWDAANGYIVTNDHVTGSADSVIVQFANGNEVAGVVVGGDSARDIAVVQIDPTDEDLVEAVFAPTESVQVGQLAVAIGSPFGLDQSVTAGIVSAVNRINAQGGSDPSRPVDVEMIQTDAPINPGNSGGALADRQGRVIGMNTQIRTAGGSDGNIGVGFAVPSDTIVLIAQRIVNGDSLELAHLGVSGITPTDGTVGALVQSVVNQAPAALAGLEAGDLVVSLDGEVISSMAELSAEVKLFRPNDQVQIEFVRDGERLQTTVTLAAS